MTRQKSVAAAAAPSLRLKQQPLQQRAQDTCEAILVAAAQLLAEVGIERLSTNLVCERAGVTPPALYRYFPNKYAILHELGLRLMLRQNALIERFALPATMRLSRPAFERRLLRLFLDTLARTREMPAGAWITRALRAVPALQHVRTGSHDQVSGQLRAAFLAAHPRADAGEVGLVIRLAVEAMYAAHELVFDQPSLDESAVGRVMAAMVAGEYARLRRAATAPAAR